MTHDHPHFLAHAGRRSDPEDRYTGRYFVVQSGLHNGSPLYCLFELYKVRRREKSAVLLPLDMLTHQRTIEPAVSVSLKWFENQRLSWVAVAVKA
jgi:hypothetical protein